MIAICGNFRLPIFGEKLAFFLKANVMIQFLKKYVAVF
jgi:hypothetical protein